MTVIARSEATKQSRARSAWVAACGALLALASPAALAADAGVTAAVNPDAQGTPPGLATRVLDIGTNVLQDEHLKTGAQGQLQVLLRDGTTVTLGPNGDLTVDKFVYDPNAGIAKLAMTQNAGLVRIIGGRASKGDEGIQVTTPTTTVGIRGGIARLEVNPQTGATNATLIYGKVLTVNVDGNVRSVSRPGLTLSVLQRGVPPGPPTKATTEQVIQANALLEGVPGRTGGTVQRVNDDPGTIQSANANGPSAESAIATVLNNPAFKALSNLQVGQTVNQALIQSVTDNIKLLANLPACNICFNTSIGGGVPVTSTSILLTSPGPLKDTSGNPYPGQGTYSMFFAAGGSPTTTLVPYAPGIAFGSTTAAQAGIVNDLTAPFQGGIINPNGLVNTGTVTVSDFLTGSLDGRGKLSQYGAGGLTAVTVNSAGVPVQIRNIYIRSLIDFSVLGAQTITDAYATLSDTTMRLNGAALAERVGDGVMQAIRTTGGNGTITETGTWANENTVADTNTGTVTSDKSTVLKWNLSTAFALSPSQSLHFILGQPPVNIPNSGVFNYNLIGATSPTFSDGSGIGVFSAGPLTMNWVTRAFSVPARVLMQNDALYTLAISGTLGALFNGSTASSVAVFGSVTVTGSSRVCPGACSLIGSGAIGGPGANHIGFTYSIGDPSTFPTGHLVGNAGNRIFGAAVFAR